MHRESWARACFSPAAKIVLPLGFVASLLVALLPADGQESDVSVRYCGRFLIEESEVGTWRFSVDEAGNVSGSGEIERSGGEGLPVRLQGSFDRSTGGAFVVEMHAERASGWLGMARVGPRDWTTQWALMGGDLDLRGETEAWWCEGGGPESAPRPVDVPAAVLEDLRRAAYFGEVDTVRSLLDRYPALIRGAPDHELPLQSAARGGSLDVLQLLVARGADVDATSSNGATVLEYAVGSDEREALDFLVACGADPLATSVGRTLLFSARSHSMVERLVQLGVDPNRREPMGAAPLHEAVRAGRDLEVIEALVEAGSDLAATTPSGETALHLAAAEDHAETVAYLLEKGMDPAARDGGDRTPLDRAREAGANEALAVLKSVGSAE